MKFLNEPLTQWLTVFFSFLIVVVTMVYTAATIAYTRVAGRQLRAMEESLEVSRQTLKVSQRAWLTITGLKTTSPLGVGQKPVVEIDIKNSGQSPAMDIKIEQNMILGRLVFPRTSPIELEQATTVPSAGVLGPGASMVAPVPSGTAWTTDAFEKFQKGKVACITLESSPTRTSSVMGTKPSSVTRWNIQALTSTCVQKETRSTNLGSLWTQPTCGRIEHAHKVSENAWARPRFPQRRG